ncbi:MAG: hypothetical protein ABIK39_06070, partial [candidate division WOR-3 bacterium]
LLLVWLFPSAEAIEIPPSENGEFLIDTSITYQPAPNYQMSPAVAFDGTNYLLVWQDNRSSSEFDIYGALVTPDGVVLQPGGIAISTAAFVQFSPAVAFDGTNYLVVWQDSRSGNSSDIYCARVTPDGVLLDPDGIPITTAENSQLAPTVAFDGTNYLVVWQDQRNGETSDIYGARVTPNGVVLDTAGIAISTAVNQQEFPVVAFDGTNYLVAWQDNRSGNNLDIYGTRVTQEGIVLDTTGIPISTAVDKQEFPAVSFDGTNYLIVWQDSRSGGRYDIYGARVTQDGIVIDSVGFTVSSDSGRQGSPAVAFDGTNYLVVWQDDRSGQAFDIYGARVTPNGSVLDPQGFAISTASGHQEYPALAFGGNCYFVLWEDGRSGPSDIYGARVTPDKVVLDPNGIFITSGVTQQEFPAASFDGTNYLVVWQDYRNGQTGDIYGARVNSDGVVLDQTGFAISNATNSQEFPAVAFDGTNYLVVWQDERKGSEFDIYGARVTPDGVVIDSNGIPISTATNNQLSPAVAFDGANFLVVWSDRRNGNIGDIYGTRVTPEGIVVDQQGFAISTAVNEQVYPAVAFDGTNYLIVWQDERSGLFDLYGARVTPGRVVLDPAGIAISTAYTEQVYPAVAFDGTNYLVVWQDKRNGFLPDIYAARVTPTGSVLDQEGIAVCNAINSQEYPMVVFDGVNFLIVWQDERSGPADLYGARVNSDGTVFDEGAAVTQKGIQRYPVLAKGGSQILLLYQGWTEMVNGKNYNTDRIWGKMNPLTGIKERSQPTAKGSRLNATIVRNVLKLGTEDGRRKTVAGPRSSVLLDISGRKVLELYPGANDVRHLPPGVYFIRGGSSIERKVVITK